MDPNGLRNFKDFLSLYNQLSEVCFNACVEQLNDRNLNKSEEGCVDRCCSKYTNMNHRIIRTYSEIQPIIAEKKMKEMEQQINEQQAMMLKQQEEAQQIEQVTPTS